MRRGAIGAEQRAQRLLRVVEIEDPGHAPLRERLTDERDGPGIVAIDRVHHIGQARAVHDEPPVAPAAHERGLDFGDTDDAAIAVNDEALAGLECLLQRRFARPPDFDRAARQGDGDGAPGHGHVKGRAGHADCHAAGGDDEGPGLVGGDLEPGFAAQQGELAAAGGEVLRQRAFRADYNF